LGDRERGEPEGDAGVCCTGTDSNINEEEGDRGKHERERARARQREKGRCRECGGKENAEGRKR